MPGETESLRRMPNVRGRDGESQQVKLLAALALDHGFKARRRTPLLGKAVRIFLDDEFRILGNACISSGAAIGADDFEHGSVTGHVCEISENALRDQAAIALRFLESM